MKDRATLSSKGQITIPKAILRELGLRTGDSLEFECHKGRAEIRPIRSSSAGVLKKFLPKDWKALTVDEMDTAIGRNLSEKLRKNSK